MMMARTPSLNASSRLVFICAGLGGEPSKPIVRRFDIIIGQAVRCFCEANCHLGARAAKKFDKTLGLGCWNDGILITSTDPNVYR